MIELTELRDGGQDPASVAAEIASFISAAEHSLELALYDVHLDERERGADPRSRWTRRWRARSASASSTTSTSARRSPCRARR